MTMRLRCTPKLAIGFSIGACAIILLTGCAGNSPAISAARSAATPATTSAQSSTVNIGGTSTSWITCRPVNDVCPVGSTVRVQNYDESLSVTDFTRGRDLAPFGESASTKQGMQVNSLEDESAILTFTNHAESSMPLNGSVSSINVQAHNPSLPGAGPNQACDMEGEYSGTDNGTPIYDGGVSTFPSIEPGQSERVEVFISCTVGVTDIVIGGVGPGLLQIQK